jgi:hypothetical protein
VGPGLRFGLGPQGGQAPGQDQPDLLGPERLEAEQERARQQRRVHLEVGVLGGGPDEHDQPVLHQGEQGVLLRPAEAVDLVEEQDGAHAVLAEAVAGPLGDLAHVLDPCAHGRQGLEGLGRGPGHQAGDRGLARSRRPPQHDRREAIGLDQAAQGLARAYEVGLADDLVEGAGPQPGSQGGLAGEAVLEGGAE